MFGGSNKRGRGGGGGRGKRSMPPPAPTSSIHRTSSVSTRGAPIGPTSSAARDRFGTAAVETTTNPIAREESFELVRGAPVFGAIVRLTPDLVEVIKQAEAQGGAARIKFDSSHNSSDNVIEVGGKEFKFTWSKEPGALCDIYEERQKGEDGHGLLVECGSAWRKLNVERILDESAKNHVKKLSEEAERQLKSRKAIVLDPANPSVKNQVKSMAAAGVDGSMRKVGWMSKKENKCKKRKVESSQVSHTAQAKSTFKSGISSNNSTKGMVSVSPKGIASLSAQASHEQSLPGISISSFGAPEDTVSPFNINRDDIGNSVKAIPRIVVHGYMHEPIVNKREVTDQPMDLRSILISLLTAHPKGMTLKALQKVVGEILPKSAQKIESFIKNVATFQAPGRYFLKPELELDSSKGVSVNGSSPGIARDGVSASESLSGERATTGNGELETQMKNAGKGDPFENSDGKPNDPDPYTSAIKVNNDNEGRTCISSESGSGNENESDSSDSGSQLRSRSKSRSPLGSGSAGSSDSESDGPSSSKEGSDVEVEIMSIDDEKDEAECKKELAKSKLWPSLRSTMASEGEHEQISSPPLDSNYFGRGDGPDGMAHEAKGRSSPTNHCVKASESHKTGKSTKSRFSDQMIIVSPDQYNKQSEKQLASHDTDKQVINNRIDENHSIMAKDNSSLEQTDILKRNSTSKSKRVSGSEYFEDKPERVKRPKASSSTQDMLFHQSRVANLSENSNYSSPAKPRKDLPKDPIANKIVFDENKGLNLQEYSLPEHGITCISKNTSRLHQSPDFQRTLNVDGGLPRPRTVDLHSGRRVLDSTERHVDYFVRASKHAAGVNDSGTESDFHLNTSAEMARTDQGSGLEKQSHARKAFPDRMLPQYETNHVGQISNAVVREYKPQKSNSRIDSTVQSNNAFLIENGDRCGKRRGISSDEELFFQSMYDRDKPELKGPIKDYSQYKEYVEEFRGKYDYYFSLNKNLENMWNDFVKVGEDLKTAKQRDVEEYYIIVRQCKEMYNQFGERHKQMKKVFILLHEELKNLKQRIKDFAQNYPKE